MTLNDRVELGYLADHLGVVATLAGWHHAEWGPLVRDWPLELAEAELRSHAARRAIPTTVVALLDGTVVGSASLLTEDMPDFPPLSPWLASVYVATGFRNQGVGDRLIRRIEEEARALGIDTLYLFTTEARDYYAARGWRVLRPIVCQGRPGVIMHLHLGR